MVETRGKWAAAIEYGTYKMEDIPEFCGSIGREIYSKVGVQKASLKK